MRPFLTLAVLALLAAAPVRAQISFAPMVGYDIDYEAATLGVAFELGTTIPALPLQPSIRPSVEFVFVGENTSVVRGDLDLIGRFSPSPGFLPYVKFGPTIEYVSVENFDSNTEIGLNLGAGAEFNRIFVEGAAGLGDISNFRIRAGYRF